MSLYIGNLSKYVGRDELERVFRRFGHCNVNLKKEGYGFVVFDFPSDAEKALRALKGRNICGELLTLTWSNKQPKSHFPEFDRGGRKSANELQRTTIFDRLGYGRRKERFDGWGNPKMSIAGRGKSVGMAGEETRRHQDDFKDYVEEKKDHREDFAVEGGGVDFKDYVEEEKDHGGNFPDEGGGVSPHLEDNGRYDEPTQDLSVDRGNGNAMEFDRYESYHGYDRKDVNEDYHADYSGGSPAANSQENVGRAQVNEETLNHTNDSKFQQSCYKGGETGHEMQNCQKQHSPRRKYNKWDVRQDDKIDRKHGVEDKNKLGSGSWAKLQSSGDALLMRHQRDKQSVSGSRHNRAPLRNESSPDRHRRKEYAGKKRSRNESESPKRSMVKISRRSVSSSLPPDYSASPSLSNSWSQKSFSRSTSHSRSRSVSSRARSSSSKLRSSSKSQNHRGKSLHSMRSSSPVSLNQPSLSSPNKVQLNPKSLTINGAALVSVDHLVAHGQQIDCTMELENLQSKGSSIAVNGKAAVSMTVEDAMEKDQYVQEDTNGNSILLNSSDGKTNLSKSIAAGNLSPRIQIEVGGFWHSGTLMMDGIPTEIQKPTSETHVNPHSGLSPIISTDEMCMVLNNYGLEIPKDYEKSLTTDAFFGAARLWPWHIIYYRRLKKGPISTDNYARRVAQNQEFGIVDKYIRSSSGWAEFSLENNP